MGFTIMDSFMDDLEVESILGLGTKITMKKVIKKEENKSEDLQGKIFTTFRMQFEIVQTIKMFSMSEENIKLYIFIETYYKLYSLNNNLKA